MSRSPKFLARSGVGVAMAVVAVVHGSATYGQLTLTEVTRFNLNAVMTAASGTAVGSLPNPSYIGNNPSAVAWNGSRLFVAGLNNGATGTNSQNSGIIEVLNTSTTGIVASTAVQYGTRFGFLATPNQKGYSGLAMQGTRLFASFDSTSVQANALRGYDISTQTTGTLWSATGRGGAGVAIDPGYVVSGTSQGGAGVGWGTFGDGVTGSSNRRALNDSATGASIYGFNSGTTATVPAGFIWNSGGFPRDLSFDPDTGDLYGRSSDAVWKAVRTGSNSAGSPSAIFDMGDAMIAIGQNIAFMSNTSAAGDLLAFNLKDGYIGGTFADYVRLSDTNGVVQNTSWNFLGGTAPTSRDGYYDFSYDTTSQTLAVADAINLRVSIFKFGAPAPDTQLTWAADGVNAGGTGTWDNGSTTWIGAYGPSAWQAQANALFSGTSGGAVTVATGGVSVGRGLSFTANGYTVAGDPISLTGTTASINNLFVGTGLAANVNSNLSATSGLSKSGAGTLVMGGTISGGNVFVNNGRLSLASTASLMPDATHGVSVLATGTLDVTQIIGGYVLPAATGLAGAGRVEGDVTVSASSLVSPGSNLGTLTVTQNVTLGAGGNYNWQITSGSGVAGSSWDLLTVGGSLSIAATSGDPFKINLWSLSATAPDVNGSISAFDSSQSYTWTIASAAGGISGFAADKFVVNTSATNGTAGFANSYGSGTFSLAQSGNDLNLVFTAGAPTVITINVPSGTQTQTQAGYLMLSGTLPVVKIGAGTLVVDQANALTASTTVQGGVLQLANGSALASSTLAVVAGGTASVANALTTTVGGLDLSGNGLVDVTSGFVTVASGLLATELVTQIIAGRNNGLWTGTSGITSSVAAAEVASLTPRAVGWLDNGDGSVAFAYAAPGDTNLDWQVNVLDAANMLTAGTFNTGSPATWIQGDFNYDGVVDVLDAADFIATGLYNQGIYNAAPGAIGAVAAVPEPSTWMVLAGGFAALVSGAGRYRRGGRRSP